MLPEVFNLLNTSDVRAFVGSSPVRIYKHGTAPQGVEAPYITWFVVVGVPENSLESSARIDNVPVQVNIWTKNDGSGARQADQIGEKVRVALEAGGHCITEFGNDGQDFETERYRLSLTFTFWNHRP